MTIQEYNDCVASWAQDLYRYALYQLRHREDAEDAVQQTYEVLWRERDTVAVDKVKSFLFTVLYRRCMDEHRKRQRKTNELDETILENYQSEQNNTYEWNELLHKTIARLDTQSRALLLLKDLQGYKYEEIATMTGLSTDQVRVYLHRTRKKIKEWMSPAMIYQL